jgi:hypothetical protein
VPLGIPWSVFAGERPAPGPGDVAWTDEDRALVLEFLAEQRLIHGACGQPLDLATGKENARDWGTEEFICHACGAKEAAEAAAAENDREGGATVRGRFFVPTHRPWSPDDRG